MNKENSLKLLNVFPQLYQGFKPMTESCMCRSFECNDGWFQIIWNLSLAIEAQARKEGRNEAKWPEANLVQEKYGTLRFYLHEASDVMLELAQAAEDKSGLICEICGAPGQTYDDSWINTSCISCRPIP